MYVCMSTLPPYPSMAEERMNLNQRGFVIISLSLFFFLSGKLELNLKTRADSLKRRTDWARYNSTLGTAHEAAAAEQHLYPSLFPRSQNREQGKPPGFASLAVAKW